MRVATQIATIVVIGGGIALGFMFRTGLLGQFVSAPPAQQAAGGNPSAGGPGGGPAAGPGGGRGGQGAPVVEVVT
ncbi:MAG: hypothetical protein INF08_10795, partial [Methylobacterium sp.]|nr:hypothetical protein [Methylobacterium sp.]